MLNKQEILKQAYQATRLAATSLKPVKVIKKIKYGYIVCCQDTNFKGHRENEVFIESSGELFLANSGSIYHDDRIRKE